MSKKLFVRNLSWNITSEELKEVFAQFGEIEDAVVINDRETGRSRGFGFVTFTEEEAADKAIEVANGQEVDGREIVVDVAQDRK